MRMRRGKRSPCRLFIEWAHEKLRLYKCRATGAPRHHRTALGASCGRSPCWIYHNRTNRKKASCVALAATLLFPSTFVQITLPDTPVLAWIGEPGNGMHISISKRSIIIWVCIRTRVLPYVLAVQLKQGFTILSYWNTGTV